MFNPFIVWILWPNNCLFPLSTEFHLIWSVSLLLLRNKGLKCLRLDHFLPLVWILVVGKMKNFVRPYSRLSHDPATMKLGNEIGAFLLPISALYWRWMNGGMPTRGKFPYHIERFHWPVTSQSGRYHEAEDEQRDTTSSSADVPSLAMLSSCGL